MASHFNVTRCKFHSSLQRSSFNCTFLILIVNFLFILVLTDLYYLFLQFMFFMSEGILTYSIWFSLIPSSPRDQKTRWHWLLHVAAMICAYTGLAAITYNKYINHFSHYSTWHGFFGIIVCGTLAIQASGGIIQMYPSILPFTIRRVLLKRLHAFSGSVTFSVAMVTLILGLYTTWFSANVENRYIWGVACSCPVVMFSAVFFQFLKNHVVQMFRRY